MNATPVPGADHRGTGGKKSLSLWFDHTIGRRLYPWHVRLYRWTNGKVGHHSYMGPMLLITTTGRKTGQPRTTPLLYMPDGANFFVVGSNGAREQDPNWLRNLEVQPQADVQAGRRKVRVRAEVMRGDAKAAVWERLTTFYPGWARYQQQTDRELAAVHLVVEP
jgi:F420H(2)-dependent quinone reductase